MGLDGAGKTTILNRLQIPENIPTIPSTSSIKGGVMSDIISDWI